MNASDQEKVIGDTSKDGESVISSTNDDGALKPISEPSPGPEAILAEADSLESGDAIPVMSTNECGDGTFLKNQDIDASTAVKLTGEDIIKETEAEKYSDDGITSTKTLEEVDDLNVPQSSKIEDMIHNIEPKPSYSKEIADLILAEADKDSSSLGEELVLRWEDDDEEEVDETPTTDVLKKLDQELAADTSNKGQFNEVTDENIESVNEISKQENVHIKKTDFTDCLKSNEDKIILDNKNRTELKQSAEKLSDDGTIKMPFDASLEHAVEHNEIDNDNNVEMMENISSEINENVKYSLSSVQVENLTQENKYQNIDMETEMSEKTVEAEKPCKNKIFNQNIDITTSEPSTKNVVEMDIGTLPGDINTETAEEELFKNKNVTQKPIETSVMDISEINKDDMSNIEATALGTNETDIVKSQSSPSNAPNITLPIEISSTDNANKDSNTSITTLEPPITEQFEVKKDTQMIDDKNEFEKFGTQNKVIDNVTQDCKLDKTMTPNIHHRINKPNIMLDIPTQELSDIEAELDDDDEDYNEEKTQNESFTIDSSPENSTDIEMKETKVTSPKADIPSSVKVITSPTIEIDGTTSKLNIKVVSPTKSVIPISKLIPNTPKSLQFDVCTKTDESDDNKLVKVKSVDEIPTQLKSDNIDTQSLELAKEAQNQKPSTSKELDVQPSTSEIKLEIENVTPSTSKLDVLSEKLTHDNDDVQEVTDSLGLLAESSRVMDEDNDDDDDADDADVDDVDDDEDFDPYEETNSEMAEDMEDSSTPPPDLNAKLTAEPTKVIEGRESDDTMDIAEGSMDIPDSTMDIVDDIECVENELNMGLPDDGISETATEENSKEGEPTLTNADSNQGESKFPPEKIFNILENVLGSKSMESYHNKPHFGIVKNYVELGGSSDSDDVEEVTKSDVTKSDVTSVNIPKEVEVMATSGAVVTSEIVSKEGEVVISKVPKPSPQKVTKINTSEVTIKTMSPLTSAIQIPETPSINKQKDEIFNLDSDDEDIITQTETSAKDEEKDSKMEGSPKPFERKCVNPECTNETGTYYEADRATAAYYSLTKRSAAVCEQCRQRASERSEALINGIKDLRPLLDLDMDAPSQQLVEISDSDSDEETRDDTEYIGERGVKFLEEHLADMINETWTKYNMESRLKETENFLMDELNKIEADAKEIDAVLDECQKKTDSIRFDFYKNYEPRRKNLGGIVIFDTPFSSYSHTEQDVKDSPAETESRYPKRRAASIAYDTPAKRPTIPLSYTPLEASQNEDQHKTDDDKEDISVVKLSAESAPADLPPCGEITRPPLKTGMIIYAMRNAFGTWLKGRIMDVQPKVPGQQFTQCRVKFEHKVKNPCKVLPARCLAYPEPCDVRMTIGTRVVALFKDPQNETRRESFYSGVIAEVPNPVNNYRYLVFFDDGYAQYVHHQDTRVVCESSNLVWEEVHPFIRDFICNYLLFYPERPMVRLHAKEKLKTEWNGKWWDSTVLQVDASIALINFDEDNRTEWIYRGSTRLAPLYLELQAAEKAGEGRTRSRLPRSKAQMRSNMPCVEYTRSDEQASAKSTAETHAQQQHNEEMRRQRAVAKKSTTSAQAPSAVVSGTPFEGVISRVVYYTPKNAVKPYKMSPHTCTVKCRRTDLLSLKDLRTYNPLAKPLLSGWERQTVRYKGHRDVVYRAPCGRRLRNMAELHKYLRILQSDLSVDLFDFTPGTHCLAEFVLHKCIVSKKDLSHGKENVPVPCVNYYDDTLPEFCSYNTERTPTAGVPLNLDPEFLCGCDCTDDCADKAKCACWKMTLEGARTIGLEGPNVGYVYRRLPEPLPSGIYECNSRCKCKQTCLNRVAQHPLQLKLQVFKTINRGWGIRALNDVPKGSFLCVYAGNLLTDATANLDGLNEGDEYLAELDYIEVVEGMKEGYEDDIPEADKKLDKKGDSSESESETTTESEDEQDLSKKDGDFQPGYIPQSNVTFKKSLRKREKAKKKEEQKEEVKKKDDCITISDDEEVREPSRFTAQAGMVDRDLISKQSSRVSVRTLFGKDEACYIMDAKVQGNIGRYLNHSCHPNVFVQNVFVDTHDPRFPWVAFFALAHVRAGAELTWNYNYDVGSVPEKVLYCYCGAPNCRGRLL